MDTTLTYLGKQGDRHASLLAQEADYLFAHSDHSESDATADDLRELSTIAANLAGRLQKIAGDALDMAEQIDPLPIGFEHPRRKAQ